MLQLQLCADVMDFSGQFLCHIHNIKNHAAVYELKIKVDIMFNIMHVDVLTSTAAAAAAAAAAAGA